MDINDEDSDTPFRISAADILQGAEPIQISHTGGEFYELVRDEIRKQYVYTYTILHTTDTLAACGGLSGVHNRIMFNIGMRHLQCKWMPWFGHTKDGVTR